MRIELVMRYYKSVCEFDETRVQDDCSVIGSEFYDFLSTLLIFHLIDAFDKAGLLENYTYRKILFVLIRAKKARVGSENWQLVRMNPFMLGSFQKVDLILKPEEPLRKKHGRPRGSRNRPKAKAPSDYTEHLLKFKRDWLLGSKNKSKVALAEPTMWLTSHYRKHPSETMSLSI